MMTRPTCLQQAGLLGKERLSNAYVGQITARSAADAIITSADNSKNAAPLQSHHRFA